MSRSGRLLLVGGIVLAAAGMLYGLHYALFIEHQTLEHMGESLEAAFTQAAVENWTNSEMNLMAYADTKYKYVRQVDAHSHWVGLAMLMIVLGVVFDRVGFSERTRYWLAVLLLVGSVLFPFAVLLQTASGGKVLASVLAVVGAACVTIALAGAAVGFFRKASAD
jgi:hypothetical protein